MWRPPLSDEERRHKYYVRPGVAAAMGILLVVAVMFVGEGPAQAVVEESEDVLGSTILGHLRGVHPRAAGEEDRTDDSLHIVHVRGRGLGDDGMFKSLRGHSSLRGAPSAEGLRRLRERISPHLDARGQIIKRPNKKNNKAQAKAKPSKAEGGSLHHLNKHLWSSLHFSDSLDGPDADPMMKAVHGLSKLHHHHHRRTVNHPQKPKSSNHWAKVARHIRLMPNLARMQRRAARRAKIRKYLHHLMTRKAKPQAKPQVEGKRRHGHHPNEKPKKTSQKDKTVLAMLRLARRETRRAAKVLDNPSLSTEPSNVQHTSAGMPHASPLIQAKAPLPAKTAVKMKTLGQLKANTKHGGGSFGNTKVGKLLRDPNQASKLKIAALKFGHQGGSIKGFLRREGKALHKEHMRHVPRVKAVLRRLSKAKRAKAGMQRHLPLVQSVATSAAMERRHPVPNKKRATTRRAAKAAAMVKNVMANMPGFHQVKKPTPVHVEQLLQDPAKTWETFKQRWDGKDGEWNDKVDDPRERLSWDDHVQEVFDNKRHLTNGKKEAYHDRPILRGDSVGGAKHQRYHPGTGQNRLQAHESDQENGNDHDADHSSWGQ